MNITFIQRSFLFFKPKVLIFQSWYENIPQTHYCACLKHCAITPMPHRHRHLSAYHTTLSYVTFKMPGTVILLLLFMSPVVTIIRLIHQLSACHTLRSDVTFKIAAVAILLLTLPVRPYAHMSHSKLPPQHTTIYNNRSHGSKKLLTTSTKKKKLVSNIKAPFNKLIQFTCSTKNNKHNCIITSSDK